MKSNSLTLPFAVIGFVALVGAASAFANQATAIPGDPPQYAEYRNDTWAPRTIHRFEAEAS